MISAPVNINRSDYITKYYNMQIFQLSKLTNFSDGEILGCPEHSDYAVFAIGIRNHNNQKHLYISLETTSTIRSKTGRQEILITNDELIRTYVTISNYLIGSIDSSEGSPLGRDGINLIT